MQLNVHMPKGDKHVCIFHSNQETEHCCSHQYPSGHLCREVKSVVFITVKRGPSNREPSINFVRFPEGCLTMT